MTQRTDVIGRIALHLFIALALITPRILIVAYLRGRELECRMVLVVAAKAHRRFATLLQLVKRQALTTHTFRVFVHIPNLDPTLAVALRANVLVLTHGSPNRSIRLREREMSQFG